MSLGKRQSRHPHEHSLAGGGCTVIVGMRSSLWSCMSVSLVDTSGRCAIESYKRKSNQCLWLGRWCVRNEVGACTNCSALIFVSGGSIYGS